VKAQQPGSRVRMTVEQHSAGLRSRTDGDSPIKLRDQNQHTLSQISSVVSEKEGSPKKVSSNNGGEKSSGLRSGQFG
jgi:NAD-dependent oxidoreductase involved in siderophore biosynthesis